MSVPTRRQMLWILGLLPVLPPSRRTVLAGESPLPQRERRFSVPLVDQQGQIISRYDASALYFVQDLGGGQTLELASIPGGSFMMGSQDAPATQFDPATLPIHRVSVAPFCLGVYAVTRGQWRQVSRYPKVSDDLHPINPLDPSPDIDNQLPIDIVFEYEAEEFCARLRNFTGLSFRLPTEAEWEYACRAGTTTKYHFGDGISLQVANYNALQRPLALTPVGSKQAPNRFGLHDMHGNVLEWCADWVHQTYEGAPVDGSAWNYSGNSVSRIGRGGCYLFGERSALSAARYHSDIRGTFSGAGFRVALSVSSGPYDPQFARQGVVSAASQLAGAIAPGEIISIFGNNIGPSSPASTLLDDSGLVSKKLAGIQMLCDGSPAPLIYVSAGQINAVVPYAVAGRTSTQVMVYSQGQTSAPVSIPVAPSAPSLFAVDASGTGQGAILNENGSANSAVNPAARGSVITLFATGEGQTNPPGVDGKLATDPLPQPVLPVEVLIGNVAAEIQYKGAAPGEVAGVLQINARVPTSIQPGNQPIVLTVGQASSANTVTVAVG